MKTIFELSHTGRMRNHHAPHLKSAVHDLPLTMLRAKPAMMPEVSELEAVRHYTQLSRLNFCIDTHCYPLGSCTMKYNPRVAHKIAAFSGFSQRHPYASSQHSQGFLQCMYELQHYLAELTGMAGVSLTPMAGAQGEFAGVAMIKAYHQARGDDARREIIVPDAAHGTNPASARMCGFKVREIPTGEDGDVDIDALKKVVGPHTAGIMLTNPSTLGVFDRNIKTIAKILHDAGGLLYYDGANLNAILGVVKPGDMGFDVIHLNLHKTFATPHGGGGPGAGPVAAGERLKPYLPIPMVGKTETGYGWLTKKEYPQSIGRLSTFMGNAGVLIRAYVYIRLLGRDGLHQVAEYATLNANYLARKLSQAGYELAFPKRMASHEFVISLQKLTKATGVNAMDMAKRLLDYGFHAPTTYFPLLIPECWLVEPTETESKQTLDALVDVLTRVLEEAKTDPERVKTAPHTLPIRRANEVKAAKALDVVYKPSQ